MRRGCVLVLVAGVAVVLACGKHQSTPTEIRILPPQIEAVHPDARSIRVPDSTTIWVQFKQPLDSATVSAGTVFLKIDTRRIPIAVEWESATRRILVQPIGDLALSQIYTVELSPEITTVDGEKLGQTFFWQFTVIGLRAVSVPRPSTEATEVAPFEPLQWSGTPPSAGDIEYDLYADVDSVAVANRLVAPLQISNKTFFVPPARWVGGGTQFWSVTEVNRSIGDTLRGPVWRFGVVSPGSPIDSVRVIATDWGYLTRSTRTPSCFQNTVRAGSLYNCAIAWNPSSLGPDARFEVATVAMTSTSSANPPAGMWTLTLPYHASPCLLKDPGPPFNDVFLAPSRAVQSNDLRFQSDLMTAYVQAIARGLPVYGFSLTCQTNVTFGSPPTMVLYYYR